jgi:hypothetical protein
LKKSKAREAKTKKNINKQIAIIEAVLESLKELEEGPNQEVAEEEEMMINNIKVLIIDLTIKRKVKVKVKARDKDIIKIKITMINRIISREEMIMIKEIVDIKEKININNNSQSR